MKRSRFTEERIIAVLREQAGGGEDRRLCGKHGVSEATFTKWKAKYGGDGSCQMPGEGSDPRERQAEEAVGRSEVG